MLNIIWMLPILLGIAGLLAVAMRKRIELTFAFAIFSIIAVLYGFALAGDAVLGYQTVRVLGIAAFAACAVWLAVSRQARKYVFTPGLLFFVLAVIGAWWAHRGQVYSFHDEFSHWGRACNQLYRLGKLPSTEPNALLFPAYPPGSTLFYTFWSWLGGAFSEGSTITASNVFMISCMMPMMQSTNWKQWKRIAPTMLICFMVPQAFYRTAYQEVIVDILLGCVMAYALIVWYTSSKDTAAYVLVSGAMLAFPLIKESGTGLAAMVLVLLVLDNWKRKRITDWKQLIPLACLLVSLISWKAFCGSNNIAGDKTFDYHDISKNIVRALHGQSPWEQVYLFQNFFRYLTIPDYMGEGNIIRLSYVEWMLVFTVLAFWLARKVSTENGMKEAALSTANVIWKMMACTFAYALVLFHLYLYMFAGWESAGLHSFDRYMSTIMTAALAVVVALVLQLLNNRPAKAVPAVLAVIMALILYINPIHLVDLTFAAPMYAENTQIERARMAPPEYVLSYVEPDDRIAWIANDVQEGSWVPFIYNCYEFAPLQLKQPFGVLLEENLPAQAIAKELDQGNWDYVYCFSLTETFAEEYASLFAEPDKITPSTLYRVVKENQTVSLHRVY